MNFNQNKFSFKINLSNYFHLYDNAESNYQNRREFKNHLISYPIFFLQLIDRYFAITFLKIIIIYKFIIKLVIFIKNIKYKVI